MLVQYDDDASFAVVLEALDSPDSWLSVSAAESLGRFKARADVVVPRLVAATAPARPTSLRMSALAPLAALAPERGRRRGGGARAVLERRGARTWRRKCCRSWASPAARGSTRSPRIRRRKA